MYKMSDDQIGQKVQGDVNKVPTNRPNVKIFRIQWYKTEIDEASSHQKVSFPDVLLANR